MQNRTPPRAINTENSSESVTTSKLVSKETTPRDSLAMPSTERRVITTSHTAGLVDDVIKIRDSKEEGLAPIGETAEDGEPFMGYQWIGDARLTME